MNRSITVLAIAAACAAANAGVVTLTPGDINGEDTNTASFSNGDVTLAAFIGNTAATFNGNASRLGIDDQGTNANAFNDPDTDPNNGNEEMLRMDFAANAGLTQLTWDFSRALVEISGFNADPLASFAGQNFDPNGVVPDLSAAYDAGTGTLSFELPFNIAFGGNDGVLNLGNAAASAGATLTLKVFDPNQAGAQLAVTSLSYDNAVPAPATFAAAMGLGAAGLIRRRRNRA